MALLIAAPSFAGVLKIQTGTTVQATEDSVKITVRLTNRGTAVARNVQVHLKLLGETLDSNVEPALAPDQSATFVFEKETDGVKKGRYPLTVLVDFHDSNQYPFSAPSGMTFSVGTDVNPDLAVLGKDVSMDEKGDLSFDAKNIGAREKQVRATLMLPRELSTPKPQINIQMGPRSQKELHFEVRNFSALAGADYPVFCYLEYELEDMHHTAVGTAVIKIVKDENLFRRYRWLWMAMVAVILAALLALAIKNHRNKSG